MYVAKEPIGGQKASVCRSVVVRDDEGEPVQAGVISMIDDDGKGGSLITITSVYTGIDFEGLTFVPTATAEEVDAMPARSWTWPPRV